MDRYIGDPDQLRAYITSLQARTGELELEVQKLRQIRTECIFLDIGTGLDAVEQTARELRDEWRVFPDFPCSPFHHHRKKAGGVVTPSKERRRAC